MRRKRSYMVAEIAGANPTVTATRTPPIQAAPARKNENHTFLHHKFEATGLLLKQKHGTITHDEQSRLGVLQTKMDAFWAEQDRLNEGPHYSFAKLTPHVPDASPPEPVQARWSARAGSKNAGDESKTQNGQPTPRHPAGGVDQSTRPTIAPMSEALNRVMQRQKGRVDAVQLEEQALDEVTSGRFIVDDKAVPGPGQVRKSEFLAALRESVSQMAEQVLSRIHQTSDDCPYIAYWFRKYKEREAASIEKAVNRYAPDAAGAGDWQDLVSAVTGKAETGFEGFVTRGVYENIPEEMPNLHEAETEEDPVDPVPQKETTS